MGSLVDGQIGLQGWAEGRSAGQTWEERRLLKTSPSGLFRQVIRTSPVLVTPCSSESCFAADKTGLGSVGWFPQTPSSHQFLTWIMLVESCRGRSDCLQLLAHAPWLMLELVAAISHDLFHVCPRCCIRTKDCRRLAQWHQPAWNVADTEVSSLGWAKGPVSCQHLFSPAAALRKISQKEAQGRSKAAPFGPSRIDQYYWRGIAMSTLHVKSNHSSPELGYHGISLSMTHPCKDKLSRSQEMSTAFLEGGEDGPAHRD